MRPAARSGTPPHRQPHSVNCGSGDPLTPAGTPFTGGLNSAAKFVLRELLTKSLSRFIIGSEQLLPINSAGGTGRS
ncbi:hypothetical protein [Actinomadura atramentaria]|uniref:hypothetical protein n=1 Tax=Actinomadura atramentaria TaxID=1990 RepID=UPI00039E0440|nr:hypothetical protein [Actinomadura atramentaria]